MSFHKRYISNEQVIRLFNDGGINRVIQWYTRGADAVITEMGIASEIGKIIDDPEWLTCGIAERDNVIIERIHKELGIQELKK